jgi:superfamily II DNA/RNA helicase
MHGEIKPKVRTELLEKLRVHGDNPPAECKVIVATDLACRGIDLPSIGHVIMFDFPKSPVEFIHRAGRTCRAFSFGKVTALVTKKDLSLAKAIQISCQQTGGINNIRISGVEESSKKITYLVNQPKKLRSTRKLPLNAKYFQKQINIRK